jgi:hypothetical protein
LRNADYDPKGGCCSSREKPLLSAAAGVSHAFFHDSGDFFDERVGDLIYLIRLSGSDSKKLWWIVTQERPMTYATVMVNLALDRQMTPAPGDHRAVGQAVRGLRDWNYRR